MWRSASPASYREYLPSVDVEGNVFRSTVRCIGWISVSSLIFWSCCSPVRRTSLGRSAFGGCGLAFVVTLFDPVRGLSQLVAAKYREAAFS